jgi:hypothetical protein
MSIWYILWPFWYMFSRFGQLYQEKYGNPGRGSSERNVMAVLTTSPLWIMVKDE